MKKRILSMAAILLFIVAMLPTYQAKADFTTTVNIYKLQADSYKSSTGQPNSDGSVINTEEIGTNVQPLNGVTFTTYEIDETTYWEYNNNNSIPKDPDLSKAKNPQALTPTAGQGLTTWSVPLTTDVNGKISPKYFVVYETGKPQSVSSSIAVPFVIGFPMTSSDGTKLLDTVNIYPKNITGIDPIADVDVHSFTHKAASYNVGESVPFILKGTLPSNFKDFGSYSLNSTLNPAFDLSSIDSANTKVVVGSLTLSSSDYSVIKEGQTVKVQLTSSGIANIAGNVQTGSITDLNTLQTATNQNLPFIQVTISPVLKASYSTGTAETTTETPLGTALENTLSITFDNNSLDTTNEVRTIAATAPANVYIGGIKFLKVNESSSPLSGAQFEIYKGDTIINWTDELIAANQTAITAKKFVNPVAGSPITLISTDVQSDLGTFEIKGLAYTDMGADGISPTTYHLQEKIAPDKYQKLNEKIPFVINETSYTNQATQITNKLKPIIPATGGIGALIFIVFGVGLVSYAYYGYKKEKAKN